MSDYNSGLPIRSQADADERVQVKIVDATTVTQQLIIDSDSNAHVEIHGNDPAAADHVVRVSEQGALTPDGLYDAANNTVPGTVGLIAVQRSATPAATDQIKHLSAITYVDVHALDISLHDESGVAYSETNPLSVTVTESKGTPINDFKDASAIAAGASDNHDYTVTALKTLYLTQIEGAASGKSKLEVKIETGVATGVFTSKFVQFNSTAAPNMGLTLKEPIAVAAGVRVRVVMTNRDAQAADQYSTIIGHEV